MKHLMTSAITALAMATVAAPLQAAEATAEVVDREGRDLGAIRLRDTPSGSALAVVVLVGLPEGIHAIHLHETGDCQSDDFSSAGGHIAGDREHGIFAESGPHPGDMPNLTVKENGVGEIEVFLPYLDVERDILDEDGAAFVMHAAPDDYESQPSGNADGRIACGAFSVRD